MTGNEYMALAMRTNDGKCRTRLKERSEDINRFDVGEAFNAALGLSGETGELNDMLKKAVFHGHIISRADVKGELGDILWYVAMMCNAFRFELDEVMQSNIDKLKKRYPDGFSEYTSQHRSDE